MLQVGESKALEIRLKSVLFATDFSASSDRVLQHAIAIARHFNSKLYLQHVVSSLGASMAGTLALSSSISAAQREASLVEHKLILDGTLQHLHHQTIVTQGDVWQELQNTIRREAIDLIVVGTHGRTGIGKLVLGSVAEQIFRNAYCPVLTVGPHSSIDPQPFPPREPRPLLFPTDFTDASLAALPYAVSIATRMKAPLVLLHLLTEVPGLDGTPPCTATEMLRIQRDAQIAATERLERLVPNASADSRPFCLVKAAEPAEGILSAARLLQANTIVMGLHRKLNVDLACHMPGSTAYEVVCRASCPVLTVRSLNC